MNRLALAAAPLTVLTLAACGSTSSPDPTQASTTAPSDAVHPLGSTITTNGGGQLTIGLPTALQVAKGSDGALPGAVNWSAPLTFVNGTPTSSSGNFDPGKLSLSASAAGKECSRIYSEGLTNPSTPVLPGKSITFTFAFSCQAANGADVLVAASHSSNNNRYLFEGKLP